MLALDHTRHSGIFDAALHSVTIIGAGGIGAITAITLAKMGVGEIDIWDGDEIEDVNVATQYHIAGAIGRNKTIAVHEEVMRHAPGVVFRPWPLFIKSSDMVRASIVISALDSINARKMVWDDVLSHEQSVWGWYIDARMGAEELQIMTVKHSDKDWYAQFIHRWNEEDVPDLPCTEKATIYTANGAAAFIGATVRKIVTNLDVPKIQSVNFKEGTIVNV